MKRILSLIISLIFLVGLADAAPLQSYYKQKFLGINTRVNPKLLQDDESPDASNINLDETGSITERDLFGQYNSTSGALGNNIITGLFKYYTSTGKYFIACAGDNVGLGSGGVFTDISPTANTVTSGTYWSAATFNDIEYLFNQSIPMQKYDGVKDGLYNPESTNSYPSTNCRYSAVHKARLWAASSESIPYRIYYSSLNNGEDWTTTGGFLDLPDTETITGLVSWGGYLFIFTETKIYRLVGSTPNDFSLVKTNSQVGTIAPRSLQITNVGMIFLARTGVYTFDGNNSLKLSDKIEPTINNISKTNIQNACGLYDGQNKYWLAYTKSGSSYNDKILIYDILLKDWFIYDNMSISYFLRAFGGTDKGELYGGSSTPIGTVWLLQEASGTESITHDTQTQFDTGTTFNTVTTSEDVRLVIGEEQFTRLLCHFSGADGAGAYTSEDRFTRQATFSGGGATISATQYKFGPTSLSLNGGADIYFPDSDDWYFGTGDFTIDFWIYFNDLTNTQYLISQNINANNRVNFVKSSAATGNKLTIFFIVGGVTKGWYDTTDNVAFSASTWHHLCFERHGTTALAFLDGDSLELTENTSFGANDVGNLAAYISIGSDGSGGAYVNGYIDDLRITKGLARWTSDFTPFATPYTWSASSGTLTSQNIQINNSGSPSLGAITWTEEVPSNTEITFQTRTGPTNDTVIWCNWERWSTSSTVDFDSPTQATVDWVSKDPLNLIPSNPATAYIKDIDFYEQDDNVSPNCIELVAKGESDGNSYENEYAERFFTEGPTNSQSPLNLSTYNWLTGWYRSPVTGQSVEFSFGETYSTENTITLTTVSENTWEPFYWYIGDISSTDKDNVTMYAIKYLNSKPGTIVIGDIKASNYYDSGDTMTSTPDDWIQYRAILANTESALLSVYPKLYSATFVYTPIAGTSESSLSSYYYTKPLDFKAPMQDKIFTDIFLEAYVPTADTSSSTVVYCDYDIDDGLKTGTISFPIRTTDSTVRIGKSFPAATTGKTLKLKYYNTDLNSKVTIRANEVRYRLAPMSD